MNKEPLAARLFATFLDELEEQLRVLNAELLALEAAPADEVRLRGVFRVMHTLKGAARAVNLPAIEQACHLLEALLAAARSRVLALGREEFVLLFGAADALADAERRLRAGQSLEGSPVVALAAALAEKVPPGAAVQNTPARVAPRGRVEVEVPASPPEASRPGLASPAPAAVDTPPPRVPDAPAERTEGALRVQSDKLDALFAGVGTLSLTSGRIARRTAELEALDTTVGQAVAQWRRSVRRLRRRLATGADAVALETLAAAEHDFERISRQLSRLAGAATRDGSALEQAAAGVAERVRILRMRPFTDACEALPRVARDVAGASGKEAKLEIIGGGVEADRAVLDGIREALLHLVRNAVDHGIEPPAVRARAGKPAQGTVTVSATLRGDRIVVTVADDGAGVDVAAVRASLTRAGRPAAADDREVAEALVRGGISTRAEASAISGRGVGLDVARAAAVRLGGRLDVSWRQGGGTTFVLESPLTLARIRAITVAVGAHLLALPTAHVESLVRLPRAAIKRVEGREVFSAPRESAHPIVPIVSLAAALGPPVTARPLADPAAVVVLAIGGERLGVIVDELRGEQELVVRALPGRRAVSPHVSGAAMLPAGGLALLLDASSLVKGAGAIRAPGSAASDDAGNGARRSTVLVVDDSLTTRTLERSVLEAAGYAVVTAVDGADGWRVLEEGGCDLVVADVEMPRMDGLTLCEMIRASERHRALPVVLVTALESAEHRARGLAAGADAYLAKSSFDQRGLLETVAQLLDPENA